MSGPTIRVLTLLELLQSHGRMTGTELAEQLNVDKRTVRRYIRSLEDLGIPVTTEQGRDGGYMLIAGFKLPPMMFTNEETLSLSLGLLAAKALNLTDMQPAISSVQAKLERVMPAKLKSRARAISENIDLMLPESLPGKPQQHLQPLLEAVQQQRSLRILYASHEKGAVERDVDPYGLLFRRGRWYMSGYCHLRRDLRTFRLDRLENIELLGQNFIRPQGFNTAEYFRQSLKNMPGNLQVRVLLHTSKEQAAEELGSMASMLEPKDEGLLLSTRTDSARWFALWLSQLPFDFSILEPVELKQALKAQAEKLIGIAEKT
ncbi:helix-turn-helix transcriptional regulator [Lacimicrobium alkaliphilum]|uniref:Transcriptional regulator n=1 Tax=Lacimicrobium alkaliphilum TaxID=1526571 RepID=A0ABQ1R827_9ALTE|nr:YafY family protein [Lacimicrobium alkaliphilum]GGD61749.1 transcriptional regulator [Lacimicrobium alkaliphilum]